MIVVVKAERPHMRLEYRRRGHGVGKAAVRIGNPVDVETAGTGNVRVLEFVIRPPVRGRQMIADVENPDVSMICQKPFGGNENVGHQALSSQEGTGSDFERRNSGFHTFDWYRWPLSHRIVTMVCPGPISRAIATAPATLIAVEPPR